MPRPVFWSDMVKGKVSNYRCVSMASVDQHLRRLRKEMDSEDCTTKLLDMLEDWDTLLAFRHTSGCRFCGR